MKTNDLITCLNYKRDEKWMLRVIDIFNNKESLLIDDTTGLTYFLLEGIIYKGEEGVGELLND